MAVMRTLRPKSLDSGSQKYTPRPTFLDGGGETLLGSSIPLEAYNSSGITIITKTQIDKPTIVILLTHWDKNICTPRGFRQMQI